MDPVTRENFVFMFANAQTVDGSGVKQQRAEVAMRVASDRSSAALNIFKKYRLPLPRETGTLRGSVRWLSAFKAWKIFR